MIPCAGGLQAEVRDLREDLRERALAGLPLLHQPTKGEGEGGGGGAAARAAPPPDPKGVRLPPEPDLDGALGQGLLAIPHVLPLDHRDRAIPKRHRLGRGRRRSSSRTL